MKLNVDFLVKLTSKCGKVYEEEISKAVEEGRVITAADVVLFLSLLTDGILGGYCKSTKSDYQSLFSDYIKFLQGAEKEIEQRKEINREVKDSDKSN
jgi:hypothetical protein